MPFLCAHWSFMWVYDDILIKVISHSVGTVIKNILYLNPVDWAKPLRKTDRSVFSCPRPTIAKLSVKISKVKLKEEFNITLAFLPIVKQ